MRLRSRLLGAFAPLLVLPTLASHGADDLSTRLAERLDRLQENATSPLPTPPGCLGSLLATARLHWDDLDSDLRRRLEPYMARPTDEFEDVGGIDVSYEAYGATTVVSRVSAPFRIWYALDSDAQVDTTDVDPSNGVPDYVERVQETLQAVFEAEIDALGYQVPLGDGSNGGGTDQYDVYLTELAPAGVYGYVAADSCFDTPLVCSSYMVLDNDYAEDIYSAHGVGALQVTAAHEYFHAIQYAYELEDNAWWMENTATWMEDIVYDDIDDYVSYLPYHANSPYLSLDTENGAWEYGNSVWPRYLSESYGNAFILEVWQRIGDVAGDNTLAALEEGLELEDTDFDEALAEHEAFNQSRVRYQEGELFWGSVPELVPAQRINTYPKTLTSDQIPNGRLARLAAQFLRFEPPANSVGTLSLAFDGDDSSALRATVVLETACSTRYEHPMPLDSATRKGTLDIPGFGPQVTAATLVISNGCYGSSTCENVRYQITASTTASSAPSDGDGDCVPPLSAGGLDCADADAVRGPQASEVTDGIDNDCDGALDEAPGVGVIRAQPLEFFQGEDFDVTYTSRYLELLSTNKYSWTTGGGAVTAEAVTSSRQARLGGMIGILASAEPVLTVTNSNGSAQGVLYITPVPRTDLVTTRPSTSAITTSGGIAVFQVTSSSPRTLLATAVSTGASPFTPQLRWISTDGVTELNRHDDEAGVDAPAGTIYLRISDAAGAGGTGYEFYVTLATGCSQDVDGDGHVSDACPAGDDCNDSNATIYPGAGELLYDGIDQDCSGGDLDDGDGDGSPGLLAGGDDCDDADAQAYPGGMEVCDAADNDCDGVPNDGLQDCLVEVCDGVDNDADDQIDEGFDADGLGGVDCSDADGDGYSEDEGDCDDTRDDVHPAATEAAYDGIDQDCIGGDLDDLDGDGYAALIALGNDCDDYNVSVHPNAPEQCDGVDNDCDGDTDEDTDSDGYGGPDCIDDDGDGYTESQGDCRDDDTSINPAQVEIPYDGIDQDCSSEDLIDADGDGFTAVISGGTDCLDDSAISYPGAVEVCDGLDNNCDDVIDEGFDADGVGGADCTDGDGDGRSEDAGDCDDADPNNASSLVESCDGQDNDCDGQTDEGFDADGIGGADCLDGDGDSYVEDGDGSSPGDCDDADAAINPAAEEVCDASDNDCDGEVDEGFDADGIGDADCVDDDHDKYSEDQGDCDDEDRAYYPGAEETAYNGRDEDCDGSDLADVDGDGYDSTEVTDGDDCDDDDPRSYPGAPEIAYNGIDEDCDGYDFRDADLDGYASEGAGGDDCDDLDPAVYPGAVEVAYDGIDQDCSGGDEEDLDGDRYVAAEVGGDDCDDSDPAVHPYGTEIAYDGIDQDCEDGDLIDVDEDLYEASEVGGPDCDDSRSDITPIAREACYDGTDNNCNGRVDEGCEATGCSCSSTGERSSGGLEAIAGAALLGAWMRRQGRTRPAPPASGSR